MIDDDGNQIGINNKQIALGFKSEKSKAINH